MLTGLKLHPACAAFAGGQHFAQLHIWFDLWSGYAVELLGWQVADGRVGAEYYLHLVVKINREINVAKVAVRLGMYFAQIGMGFLGTMKAWIACVIGGIGSLKGAFIGGLLLGVSEALISGFISSAYRDAIAYGLVMIVLVFLPKGIFGRHIAEKV